MGILRRGRVKALVAAGYGIDSAACEVGLDDRQSVKLLKDELSRVSSHLEDRYADLARAKARVTELEGAIARLKAKAQGLTADLALLQRE